jgi:hypothetical protein
MARQGYDLALTRHRAPHKLPARLARWVGRGDYTLAGDPERRVAGGAIAKSGSFSDRKVAASMRARDSDAPQRPSFQVGTHRVSTFHMSNGPAELYGLGHLYVTRPANRIKRRRTYADPKERSPVHCHVHSLACGDTDRYKDILWPDRQRTIFPNEDDSARVYLEHS